MTSRRCVRGGWCRCWRRRVDTRVPFVRDAGERRAAGAAVGRAWPRALRPPGRRRARSTQPRRTACETVEKRGRTAAFSFDEVPEAWDLFSAGAFEDDVAIVNAARSAARPPRVICSVAAGVRDFASRSRTPTASTGSRSGSRAARRGRSSGPRRTSSWPRTAASPSARPTIPLSRRRPARCWRLRCAELAPGVDRDALWARGCRARDDARCAALQDRPRDRRADQDTRRSCCAGDGGAPELWRSSDSDRDRSDVGLR